MKPILLLCLLLCSCAPRLVSKGTAELWEDPHISDNPQVIGLCVISPQIVIRIDPIGWNRGTLAHEVLGHLTDAMHGDWRKAVEIGRAHV